MDRLDLALRMAMAAQTAWDGIAHRQDLHQTVAQGADGTPTTRADQVLEDSILAIAADEGVSVLSEEAGFVDHGSDVVAVVDPLDGSRNAGRGVPLHCTSVAIGAGGLLGLEAAVVQNLVTRDVYAAGRGRGATLNGRQIERRRFDPEEIVVGLIVDYSRDEVEHARRHAGHHVRDLGSAAIEMSLVATGAFDAFVVQRPWLRVVDIAGATLIAREAGCLVIDPATGEDLATPFDLATRTGVVAAHTQEALEAVL